MNKKFKRTEFTVFLTIITTHFLILGSLFQNSSHSSLPTFRLTQMLILHSKCMSLIKSISISN